MYCPNCGQQQPDDTKFCSNCGADLQAVKQESNPTPTPVAENQNQNPDPISPQPQCLPQMPQHERQCAGN